MTYLRDITQTPNDGVAIVDSPGGLRAIREANCAAVIWRRAPMVKFQHWIDSLEEGRLPHTRMVLPSDMVCEALVNVTRNFGLPDRPERDMLVEDASALAAIFADVMNVSYLRVRLDVIKTNACRKFHIDAVKARLICTYRGTGTQLGVSRNGNNPDEVSTVPTGSPVILRGTAWPETPITGLMHRSPPIEGTDETRLVLVIDPIADIEGVDVPPHHSIH